MTAFRHKAGSQTYRIGIDVGGTFTDVVLVNEISGAVEVTKVLNSRSDRAESVLGGIKRLMDRVNIAPDQISWISHGTTITTNAVIERKGAHTALITNKGFRDVLEIGRFNRPPELIYRIYADKPAPYVPRALRFGVPCRVDRNGNIVTELNETELAKIIDRLRGEKIEAVAVCFLFSFLQDKHEEQVRQRIKAALPDIDVVLSSEILREFREFQRTSTTVFAAYVAPVLRRYIGSLVKRLESQRITSPLYIFQSNGGIARPDVLMRNPALTLISGPAGAVVGAAQLCGPAGYKNIITMDIGGTSLDVCVVENAQFEITKAREIDFQPVAIPMLNVHSVGAGGGSVIRVDDVGRVTVGPDSVGSCPGPACYGQGGSEATLTDVNVVLGLVDPANFANGEIPIYPEKAADVVVSKVGKQLGLGPREAAAGVYRVATNQIAEAIRMATVEGGYDPRDFTLVAFGGGGPLHACAVARDVGIGTVLVPRHPGLFSARGIALSDFLHDYIQSVVRPLASLDGDEIEKFFAKLEADAHRDLTSEGIDKNNRQILRSLEMRYAGQSSEISVPLAGATGSVIDYGAAEFHKLHHSLYSYSVPDEPIELVNVRVRAIGAVPRPPLIVAQDTGDALEPNSQREIYLAEERRAITVPVYRRADLKPGYRIAGPAIVEEASSTTLLITRTSAVIDKFDNLVIEVKSA
jgi:N-methylhydantoinase A